MDNQSWPFSYDQQRTELRKRFHHRSTSKRLLRYGCLALGPLLACAACMALMLFVTTPVRERSADPLIAITGQQPTPAVTTSVTPVPEEPEAAAAGSEYRAELEIRLTACYKSFQHFFLYEEMALNEPSLFAVEEWRTNAGLSAETFRNHCEPLGEIPSATSLYAEVDYWLKLAADEVAPAAESFSKAISDQPGGSMRFVDLHRSTLHIYNFLEFTQNAETALSSLDERREF